MFRETIHNDLFRCVYDLLKIMLGFREQCRAIRNQSLQLGHKWKKKGRSKKFKNQ